MAATPPIAAGATERAAGGHGPLVDADNPWPGLAAYEESSRRFFHGREAEAAELTRLVLLAPLTALYGRSGLGKTSLLQAGVFPLLRAERHLPIYVRIDFSGRSETSPLEQVALRLAEDVLRAGAEATARHAGQGLWEYLHRADFEIWSVDNHLLKPVFVLDQFEELFSVTGGDANRVRSVFNALADLIENRIPPDLHGDRERCAALDLLSQRYRILLSFREDFLPEIETWKDQLPSLLRNRLRLLPMSRGEAVTAAERAGAAVLEPGVAARIVDFVASRDGTAGGGPDASVEPVLLSLCCYQLNRRRAPGGRIDAALLASAGQDILQSFYHEALEAMPDRVRRFIETHLIQGDRYRGSYPRDEAFAQGDMSPAELAELTDRFRLLRVDQQADTARIELIHDRLVGVVRQARDERLARERELEQQRLRARAEQVAREEAERRRLAEAAQARTRRMRNALVALAAVLVLALGGVFWLFGEARRQRDVAARNAATASENARIARENEDVAKKQTGIAAAALEDQDRQRKLARSRELIAFALQQLDQDPELSMLLAREAIKEADTAESVAIFQRALAESHVRQRFQGSPASLRVARFLRDGRRVVTGGEDGMVRVWDIHTGRPARALGTDRLPVRNVWISGDGRRIVARSVREGADGRGAAQLTAWDADTLAPAWKRSVARDARITLSLCCSRLLVHDGDTLILLETSSGREVAHRRLDDLEGAGFAERGGTVLAVTNTYEPGVLTMCASRWTTHRWRADTGERLGEPTKAPGSYGSVSVNPYGTDIVSGSVGSAEMGNCSYMEQPVWLLMPENRAAAMLGMPGGGFGAHAFSPADVRTVALARGPLVHVWTAITTGSSGARVQLRHQFTHAADVVDVAFSDDGQLVLGADHADTVRIWSRSQDRGAPLRVLRARGHGIVSAGFSADRRHVLTAGADGTARLWAIPKDADQDAPETCTQCRATSDWLALAESRLTRTFTADEAKRYGITGRAAPDEPRAAR